MVARILLAPWVRLGWLPIPCTKLQAACGGRSEDGTYIEVFSFGAVAATSQASRMAAGIAGGLATVVRNPVPASYLRSHAASAVIRRL